MCGAFKKVLCRLMTGANIATVLAMMITGYADRLNPVSFPSFANLGLIFPGIVIVNLLFLAFWVFFHFRGVWIPFVGFLLCYGPVRNYVPINLKQDVPEGAIKVLSYNVWYYAGWNDKDNSNPILNYLVQQDADILCLQEAETNEVGRDKVKAAFDKVYPYHAVSRTKSGSDMMVVYSKFPIIGQEPIEYQSEGNHSAAFFLNVNGDTLIVINNHFETVGLSEVDKANFKGIVKGDIKGDSAKIGTQKLIGKLGQASKIRAPQADAVAKYIEQYLDKSMIVCGDFNDGPNSYVHRTVSKHLTDCYIATANGPGISYHLSGFYVRIDHLMCTQDLVPYACRVDNKIKASDHYPIYCWLKKRPKP